MHLGDNSYTATHGWDVGAEAAARDIGPAELKVALSYINDFVHVELPDNKQTVLGLSDPPPGMAESATYDHPRHEERHKARDPNETAI